MLERGQKINKKNNDNCFGVFEFDAFLSCVFGHLKNRGGGLGGGGEAPLPKR